MKNDFELRLNEEIENRFKGSQLKEPISYALLGGGKRIRSLIVLLIGDVLGKGLDVTHAALAMEFAHTSSLILDDLPMMDDDAFRRGKPALHRAFSEPIALMTSVALISEAYHQIYLNGEKMSKSRKEGGQAATIEALKIVSHLAGASGTPNGQLLDIHAGKYGGSQEFFEEMIYLKTGTLFEASFALGWLFGGGAIEQIDKVRKAATSFGRLFQIADDISDLEEDSGVRMSANFAELLGEERAREEVEKEKERLSTLLNELNLTKLQPILFHSLQLFLQRKQEKRSR